MDFAGAPGIRYILGLLDSKDLKEHGIGTLRPRSGGMLDVEGHLTRSPLKRTAAKTDAFEVPCLFGQGIRTITKARHVDLTDHEAHDPPGTPLRYNILLPGLPNPVISSYQVP